MTITESRLKGGTLTLDAIPFATQATNVRLEPNTDEVGDPIETLSGDELSASDETSWTLVIEAIQDFDDVEGFVRFALDNAGDLVPFVWRPNSTSTNQFTGTVRVRPVVIGGDVNKRLPTTANWPLQGDPTPGTAT